MVSLESLIEELELSTLKLKVKVFEELDSTNTESKRQIEAGIDQDLLVVAKQQTTGHGRQSRSWFSPYGGLYFSLVVKPRLGLQYAPLAGFLSGCAVAKGLQTFGIDYVNLKWPNDVLVYENKIAGILNELVSFDSINTWMILGIGVNQNIPIDEFPSELIGDSTSMYEILKRETSPNQLLSAILQEFDRLFGIIESEQSYSSILKLWRSMSGTLGRRVRVKDNDQIFTGIAEELLDDGSLILLTEDGREKITIGDVTHLRKD